jgi:hypothetical protein
MRQFLINHQEMCNKKGESLLLLKFVVLTPFLAIFQPYHGVKL